MGLMEKQAKAEGTKIPQYDYIGKVRLCVPHGSFSGGGNGSGGGRENYGGGGGGSGEGRVGEDGLDFSMATRQSSSQLREAGQPAGDPYDVTI